MGSLQSWLHRHEAGWRPDIARREEARGARKPEQPVAAVEYEYRCAEYEYEYRPQKRTEYEIKPKHRS